MNSIPLTFKKRIGLELFRKYRDNIIKLHELNYLMWECTLRCNLNCLHCGSDCKKNSAIKDMPAADFLKVIDDITPHVNPEKTMIVLTGGEPLLRNDIEQCGLELYNRRYPWGIVTNGLLLSKAKLERLLSAGLRSITVSLDGLHQSHNWLRDNPQSFQKAFDAVKMITTVKDLKYDVVTCINRHNYKELDSFKELLIFSGIKQWRIFTIFPSGRAQCNADLNLTPDEFKGLFRFIKQTRDENHIQLNYGCEGFLGNYELDVRDHFFFCQAGISIASVLADGSISACPSLRANFIQGNIYKDSFIDVWNGKFDLHRKREWAKTGKCKECKYFRYCLGNGLHLRDEASGELMFCHLQRMQE